MLTGIKIGESVSQNSDGRDTLFHGGGVCGGIDSKGKSADDKEIWLGQVPDEPLCHLPAMVGGLPGTYYPDNFFGIEIGCAPIEQQRRKVGHGQQSPGVVGVREEENANAV